MSNWIILGSIVGALLGLTGAGGSVIALPLLQRLAGLPIHDASVAVLPIVGIGALISVFPQRRDANLFLAALILAIAVPSTYLTAMVKDMVPGSWITGLILGFIGWALYQTWRPGDCGSSPLPVWRTGLTTGILSGIVTTLTGLGGGVILTPMLKKWGNLNSASAIATSMVIIGGNALVSFTIQKPHTLPLTLGSFFGLAIGLLLASVGVGFLLKKCPKLCSERLRKGVYTGILIAAGLLLMM